MGRLVEELRVSFLFRTCVIVYDTTNQVLPSHVIAKVFTKAYLLLPF